MATRTKSGNIRIELSLKKHIPSYIFTPFIILFLTAGGSYLLYLFPRLWIFVVVPYFLIIGFIILEFLSKILTTRSFSIEMNSTGLEIRHGIFNKTIESIDMHRIKDFVVNRDLVDQIFGLATLTIL